MIFQNATEFKYIDRHYNKTLVFIPGWATDFRIFHFIDMPYNYIIPITFSPFTFKKALVKYLKNKDIKMVSILGFSLGGFIAQEYAGFYPEMIEKIILVGIRKKYKKYEIERVANAIKADKIKFLHRFYSLCIPKKQQNDFWKLLFADYCDISNLQTLIKTLLYLKKSEINLKNLKNIKKIILVHGEKDKIAPINEVLEIKNSLKNAEIKIIKNTGHIPFLKENIRVFYE